MEYDVGSLITSEKEILNKNDVTRNNLEVKFGEENKIYLENTVQTEKSCNLTNTGTYLLSNIVSANKINSQISSQSNVTPNTILSLEVANLGLSETMENNAVVNFIEQRNISLKDTESTESDSSCFRYSWSSAPRLLCTAIKEYKPTDLCENFTKGCQWSPDGTCLLVPSEDFKIRIYELPKELYSGRIPPNYEIQSDFTSALTIKEGGLIYDICWYPFMSAWEPATCCFLSTSKESPVHLWDAITGELRATYRAYNQVDEVEASISIQFVDSAKEIWCGFKNAVRTFDTNRPGRQTNTIQFKHDFPNMNGLVSCIRENPIMPGLVAFGSYAKCIGLYKDGPLCTFKTGSGVTQVEFSSCGMKLFSVVRRNSEFLCWDLRNPGVVLYSLEGRKSDTNQKIQFAITPDNKQIVSGGTDGNIIVWESSEDAENNEYLEPKYKVKLSVDCINGVSLHRNLPIIGTSSGQRQCGIESKCRDNSVRLWWVS